MRLLNIYNMMNILNRIPHTELQQNGWLLMRSNVYLIGNKLIEINESLKNELIDLNILKHN